MRLNPNALLALPALLSAYVVAIPSPAHQHTLDVPIVQPASRWRSLSDRLIEKLWRVEKTTEDRLSRPSSVASEPLSRHTLARYGNDVVLRFTIATVEEATSLSEAADTLLLDIWDFTHSWVDVRLSRDLVPSLLGLLPPSLQHAHTPLLRDHDLAQAVYDSYPRNERSSNGPSGEHSPGPHRFEYADSQRRKGAEDGIFFQQYQPLSTIEPWMRFLSEIYSTHVSLISIGESFEGRDILGLRVGAHPTTSDPEKEKRKTVLVTGGMHAREWVSTSTVNYVAFNFISSYGLDDDMTELLNKYDFVFIPTVNPDGYDYTWKTDRLWRKNRQQTSVRFCQGLDLDHGFGFAWDSVTTAGNPCSESYAGESPFEAAESKALADWAKHEADENSVEFVGFIDLHSYSQQILYPYSYSCDATPPSQENLEELALGIEKAIRRASGFGYESMAACEGNNVVPIAARRSSDGGLTRRIEQSGGSALDWFYHEMNVKYAYQVKLRDRGTYGFLLPKENIVPVGKEILGAMRYFGEFLSEGYPKAVEVDSDGEEESEGLENDRSTTEDGHGEEHWVVLEYGEDFITEPQTERRPDLRRRRRR